MSSRTDCQVRTGVRLAVDPGTVRIGVARSDPRGVLATPLTVVRRGKGDLDALASLAATEEAMEILVGLPRSLSGREGPAAATARKFAADLAARVAPLPGAAVRRAVHHVDRARGAAGAGTTRGPGGRRSTLPPRRCCSRRRWRPSGAPARAGPAGCPRIRPVSGGNGSIWDNDQDHEDYRDPGDHARGHPQPRRVSRRPTAHPRAGRSQGPGPSPGYSASRGSSTTRASSTRRARPLGDQPPRQPAQPGSPRPAGGGKPGGGTLFRPGFSATADWEQEQERQLVPATASERPRQPTTAGGRADPAPGHATVTTTRPATTSTDLPSPSPRDWHRDSTASVRATSRPPRPGGRPASHRPARDSPTPPAPRRQARAAGGGRPRGPGRRATVTGNGNRRRRRRRADAPRPRKRATRWLPRILILSSSSPCSSAARSAASRSGTVPGRYHPADYATRARAT